MKVLSNVRYMLSILTKVCIAVTQLTWGILSLKEGVDSFFEYMHILASHKVNPLIVPPSDLRNILLDVKNEIYSHPRLALHDGLDVNI